MLALFQLLRCDDTYRQPIAKRARLGIGLLPECRRIETWKRSSASGGQRPEHIASNALPLIRLEQSSNAPFNTLDQSYWTPIARSRDYKHCNFGSTD